MFIRLIWRDVSTTQAEGISGNKPKTTIQDLLERINGEFGGRIT